MSLTKVASDGIEALAITNAHLHTAANIAHSKLADSGASAGSYGSSTAIPSVTVNAKGLITSISQTSIDTDLVADSSPQLGGDLDVNDRNILNGTAILDITENSKFEFSIGGTEYLDINSSGIIVTGSISVSSTVDGRDLATDGSKLDGIESGATADQTSEEIQDIVGAMFSSNTESGITVTYQDSDGTIDLSVASQTDNNFTNADHSKLDGIEAGATADQSNSEIKTAYEANSDTNAFTDALLSKLNGIAASATNVTNNNQLTNGAGYITSASLSGVSDGGNAALLDGVDSTSFARSDQDDSLTGIISLESNSQYPLCIDGNHNGKISLKGSSSPYIGFFEGTTRKAYIQWESSGNFLFNNEETGEYLRIGSGSNGLKFTEGGSERTVWHSGNDGAGSGLDADTLDGITSGNFLRADTADTADADITFNGGAGAITVAANSDIRLTNGNWTGNHAGKIQHHSNSLYIQGGSGTYSIILRDDGGSDRWYVKSDGRLEPAGDSNYDIGSNGVRVANGYFDTLYGDGSNLTGIGGGVESGTKMLFYQANAPTGWTKQTSQNNKALRVVSGSGGGTGGSNNFTTAFNSSRGTSGGSVSNHTLTTAQMPSHRHKVDTYNEFGNTYGNWTTQGGYRQAHANGTRRPPYTSYEGSGNAHNHGFSNPSLNLNVQYIDVIVAQKD